MKTTIADQRRGSKAGAGIPLYLASQYERVSGGRGKPFRYVLPPGTKPWKIVPPADPPSPNRSPYQENLLDFPQDGEGRFIVPNPLPDVGPDQWQLLIDAPDLAPDYELGEVIKGMGAFERQGAYDPRVNGTISPEIRVGDITWLPGGRLTIETGHRQPQTWRNGSVPSHVNGRVNGTRRRRHEPVRAFRVTPFSDIAMRPTHWLWADDDALRIPIGELSLFAGHGDVGKSTAAMWLTASVSRGKLHGERYGSPGNCLIAAAEDSRERTIKPRLYVAKADLSRIFYLDVTTVEADGLELCLPTDFGLLREAILDTQAAVCFFDSLMSVTDLSLDMHKGRDTRAALQPLGRVANETDCAIIGNVHFNKSSSSDPAMRLLNSVEIRNVARSIIYFAEKDGDHVLSRGKGNLGREWPPLSYSIEDASFAKGGQRYQPGRFVLGGESSVSAQDMLRGEGREGEGRSRTADCAIWLSGWMGEQGGSAERESVMDAGKAEGYTDKMIREAYVSAHLNSKRSGFGPGATYLWFRSTNGKHSLSDPGPDASGDDGNDTGPSKSPGRSSRSRRGSGR